MEDLETIKKLYRDDAFIKSPSPSLSGR
jgi:hypothetical protein